MTQRHRLVLVRHAKAAGSSSGGDRGRPLTDKGRTSAAAGGAWLAERVPRIDAIWSSSAVRARQTSEGLASSLTDAPAPELRDDLYDAGPDDVVELLATADDDLDVVAVVGHNPTIEAVHHVLTGEPRGFRPGAIAVVELTASWGELADVTGGGRLLDFWSPG